MINAQERRLICRSPLPCAYQAHGSVDAPQAMLLLALQRRERELQIVNEIIALVNHPADLPRKLSRALDIARDALGTHIIILSLLDDEGRLSYTAWSCAAEIEEKVLTHCRDFPDRALLYETVQTGRVFSIRDVQEASVDLTEAQRKAYRRLNVRRLAYVPIASDGRTMGVISLMRHNVPDIGNLNISFFDEISALIVMLVKNATLQSQIRELSIFRERRRLARELHDSVTQSLFTLSLAAQGLKVSLQDLPGEHQHAVDLLIDQTQTVQRDMRSLIEELRPVELQEQQLERELHRHVNSLRRTTGIAVDLELVGNVRDLPRSMQRHLNRIAQEALSNVAQHACATQVSVKLEIGEGGVLLCLADDGIGFDLQHVMRHERGSLGLKSMRERIEMMGGVLSLNTAPGHGTVLEAHIPLQQPQEQEV